MRSWHFVGLDVGQAQDHTAIAVVEYVEFRGEWDAVAWAHRKSTARRLRYLERIPLHTRNPAVTDHVVETVRSEPLAGRCHLVVDATGVGGPVVDDLRMADPGCTMLPVTITGGTSEASSGDGYSVPKRDLITGVQVLLQRGDLEIAAGIPHAGDLLKEMAEMRVKVTASGREQYEAWRAGAHDDLVLAVALACWGARKIFPAPPRGEAAYWKGEDQGEWEREMRRAVPRIDGRR